jgi:hypothetical protein
VSDLHATVRDHDVATRCGHVLVDDGRLLAYDADAFGLSGLRLLRRGQRVLVRLAEPTRDVSSRLVGITLASLDL